MPTNQLVILQAGIVSGLILLILNVAVVLVGLPTLTIIMTNKFERKKLAFKTELTSAELFLVILKAFGCALVITVGVLAVLNLMIHLCFDFSLS